MRILAIVTVLAAACGDDGAPAAKRVFTTSTTFSGDLGGLAGGDAKCNAAAAAAGLGGTWTAWLSDATTDAIDRITDVAPWTLLDGTVAFPDAASLATHPSVALDTDELGRQTFPCVWTGTVPGGTKSAKTCSSWTSTTDAGGGLFGTGSPDARWTEDTVAGPCGANTCSDTFRLYCFEQ